VRGRHAESGFVGEASGGAAYGVLRVRASATAHNSPGTYNCGTGDVMTPLRGYARAITNAAFSDDLMIDSTTLPPGTIVRVRPSIFVIRTTRSL